MRRNDYPGGTQIVTHRRSVPYADPADKDLRQRDGVDEHLPGCAG